MWDLSVFATGDAWAALASLAALEIVLGIDNLVFLSILCAKLPTQQQSSARRIGLLLALGARLGLLFALTWLAGLTVPLFSVREHSFSARDLILGLGGLFLVAKATWEIFSMVELEPAAGELRRQPTPGFAGVLIQVTLLDIVFSLDSVITAVGMTNQLPVMTAAIVIAVIAMIIFADSIATFIDRHPSMKVLGLAFLLLVGVVLCAESLGQHIAKGYIYFAMGFSLLVEIINVRMRKKRARSVAG